MPTIETSIIIPTLNEKKVIRRCLETVVNIPGIEVIVSDGGSTDKTMKIIMKADVGRIHKEYDQKDSKANGKQRNFYLNALKKSKYEDWWCLCLDADEVLEDFGIQKIKQIISTLKEPMVLSPR
ncbi:hypothetical protein LCGC14_1971510, partial [marine sediment metagenome]